MSNAPQTQSPLFAGKYRLVRVLGKGAMGEVWLAEEEGPRNFRRRVAVKRLLTSGDISDYATESFIAEAQVIARIDHPNVVRLVELGSADGGLYLVLDYVDGPALDRMIKKGGAFSPKAVAYMGREVARALEAVHSMCDEDGRNYGVVHRDVSPSNILVSRDGRVRLSDFGVARISGLGGEKTQTGVFKGKLPYMPPEQARGDAFDGRADIFSLGVTLFEALLGGRLRRAETQGQLITMIATERIANLETRVPDAPPILARAIDGATEFDARARVRDAGEFATELDEALRSFGPRADKEAREELRARVAAIVGAPMPSNVSSSGLGVSLSGGGSNVSAVAPPAPAPTGAVAEWSVPLRPTSDGQLRQEETSQPSVQSVASAVRSTGTHSAGDPDELPTVAAGGLRATPSPAFVEPPSAPPRKPGALVALAGVALVGGALAAVLVLQRAVSGDPAAPTASALASAAPELPSAEASAASAGTIATTASAAPTTDTEPVASATAEPSGKPSEKTSPTHPFTHAAATPTPKGAPTTEESAGSTDPGTLQVVVLPWADVSIDGRSAGTTPIAPVSLTPGNHGVVLRNSELGATRSLQVTIKPGKPTLLRVDLRRTE